MSLTRYWVPQVYCDKQDEWPESPLRGGGYDIYKADDVRAVLQETRKGLEEIAQDCTAVSEDNSITIGERRTWRVMARKALRLLTRLQEIAP